MSTNRDCAGIVVRSGHTVRRGINVGLVQGVAKGKARVRWISGTETLDPCPRLTVVRSLGRISIK